MLQKVNGPLQKQVISALKDYNEIKTFFPKFGCINIIFILPLKVLFQYLQSDNKEKISLHTFFISNAFFQLRLSAA